MAPDKVGTSRSWHRNSDKQNSVTALQKRFFWLKLRNKTKCSAYEAWDYEERLGKKD